MLALDSWINAISKIGLGKATQNKFCPSPEPDDETLSDLFEGDWLARKIVLAYPETAFQRGFRLAKQNEALLARYNGVNFASNEEGEFLRAESFARLHGGSIIILGATGGELSAPMHPGARIEWVEAVSRVNLEPTQESDVGKDVRDPLTYNRPIRYRIRPPHRMGGLVVHYSKCIVFSGAQRAPRAQWKSHPAQASIYDDWGLSVLAPVFQVLSDYGISWQAVSELLQISSIGVLKMSGLIQAIAQHQKQEIEVRAELMETLMSVNRLLMLDAEAGEEYERKPVSFADIPQLLQQITLRISACSEIPVTVLMGQQPSGLNSSGETDLTQWYDRVDQYRRTKLQRKLERYLGALEGKDSVAIEWGDLQNGSEKAKEEIRRVRLQNDEALWRMGVISEGEIRKARAEDGTLGIEVENPDELPERKEPTSPGMNDPFAATQPEQNIGERETSENGPDDAPQQ